MKEKINGICRGYDRTQKTASLSIFGGERALLLREPVIRIFLAMYAPEAVSKKNQDNRIDQKTLKKQGERAGFFGLEWVGKGERTCAHFP